MKTKMKKKQGIHETTNKKTLNHNSKTHKNQMEHVKTNWKMNKKQNETKQRNTQIKQWKQPNKTKTHIKQHTNIEIAIAQQWEQR